MPQLKSPLPVELLNTLNEQISRIEKSIGLNLVLHDFIISNASNQVEPKLTMTDRLLNLTVL